MPERSGPGPTRAPRTLLAFDFGRRRIGVAAGEDGVGTAGALPALRGDMPGPDWAAIAKLVEHWKPQLMLVGKPHSLDGSTTWMTGLATAFARELGQRFGVPVEMVDETLTTREARAQIAEQRRQGVRRRRVQRGEVDSTAAQIVLQGWLERHAATQRRTRLG
jgi:putative Holliday junction resolvase